MTALLKRQKSGTKPESKTFVELMCLMWLLNKPPKAHKKNSFLVITLCARFSGATYY